MDDGFDAALRRAKADLYDTADLNTILRGYLQACLDADLEWRASRPNGRRLFGGMGGIAEEFDLDFTQNDYDVDAIAEALGEAQEALANRDVRSVAQRVQGLMEAYGLPHEERGKLALGVLEVHVHLLEEIQRRNLNRAPLVFDPTKPVATAPVPATPPPPPPTKPTAPLASTLVDAFADWGTKSGGWWAGAENQAKVSVGLFLEICGDKPIDAYSRTDGDAFRTTLRQLPTVYRKSPKDRDKTLAEIIAAADTENAARISDKTVKRHFWAVSRFFAFLM